MSPEIKNFFYPTSVCVVGASSKPKSIGYEILNSIKTFGYRGEVYPVNPKGGTVLDYSCFTSTESIETPIDLAIIVVPKQFAEESVDALLRKNVKSILLITAGFKEIGKEGAELEKRIIEKIRGAGARMVGPNCMGVINALGQVKLNATFVAEKPQHGKTGFLSQSGALGAAVLNSLRETDIRFAHFISVGNKADINENDIISFWQEDENISTITLYLESFVNGKEFAGKFRNGEITKPVIVLKAGKSAAGMKAASSHTGALSGEDRVADSILKQYGIVRAENLNELFNTAKGFEHFPIPKGKNIAVITNAGGPAILAVDRIEKENLSLGTLSEGTKSKLREIVHPEGSVENPVDLLPGATADIYKKVNEIVVSDPNIDAVISIFVEPVMVSPFEVIEAVNSIESEKPILQAAMPLPEFWNKYRIFSSSKKPVFRNPEDPAEVISNMLFYSEARKKIKKYGHEYSLHENSTAEKKYRLAPGFLLQEEVNRICGDYGIPVIRNIISNPEEVNHIPADIFPVVLKGMNGSVVHKSEMNAVKLNIKNAGELTAAAREISDSFSKSGFAVENFLIQPFIKSKHELLIGGYRDPSFGPIVMFGSGGKYVEVIRDTSLRSAYLCEEDIDEMIGETSAGKILSGVRGEKPADMNAVRSIIRSAAKLLAENENISELDLNPVILSEDGKLHAVDVRIKAL